MALMPREILRTSVQSGLLGDEAFPKPGPSGLDRVAGRMEAMQKHAQVNMFQDRFRQNEARANANLQQERFRADVTQGRMPGLRPAVYAAGIPP